jgi:hypothetical protein
MLGVPSQEKIGNNRVPHEQPQYTPLPDKANSCLAEKGPLAETSTVSILGFRVAAVA